MRAYGVPRKVFHGFFQKSGPTLPTAMLPTALLDFMYTQ